MNEVHSIKRYITLNVRTHVVSLGAMKRLLIQFEEINSINRKATYYREGMKMTTLILKCRRKRKRLCKSLPVGGQPNNILHCFQSGLC